jgi:hypothetical protein
MYVSIRVVQQGLNATHYLSTPSFLDEPLYGIKYNIDCRSIPLSFWSRQPTSSFLSSLPYKTTTTFTHSIHQQEKPIKPHISIKCQNKDPQQPLPQKSSPRLMVSLSLLDDMEEGLVLTTTDNTLNIKIVSTDGSEVFFKIKKTTKLNKLKVSLAIWRPPRRGL